MIIYAQLNDNDICTGISQLSGEVQDDKLINITDDTNHFDFLWKKYDREEGTWSTEKFEPVSTAPVDEFEQMKNDLDVVAYEVLKVKGLV